MGWLYYLVTTGLRVYIGKLISLFAISQIRSSFKQNNPTSDLIHQILVRFLLLMI